MFLNARNGLGSGRNRYAGGSLLRALSIVVLPFVQDFQYAEAPAHCVSLAKL